MVNKSKVGPLIKYKTEGKNQERAERIFDVAAALIAHYGYDKTTVDDIAREAGVSKGAIYLHWPSKEALFDALILRESEQLLDDMLARVEADPEGGTLLTVYKHGLLAAANNPLMRAVLGRDQRVLGNYMRRQSPDLLTQRFAMQLMFVQQMQRFRLVRTDITAEVIAHVLSIFTYGTLAIIRDGVFPAEQMFSLEEIVQALTLILPKGLVPEGGGEVEEGKQFVKQYLETIKGMLLELSE